MSLLAWIVVGLIAGALAGWVTRGSGHGFFGNIIVGVLGGLLGGWLANSVLNIGADVNGINLESILVAFVGAVILIFIVRLFRGSASPSVRNDL